MQIHRWGFMDFSRQVKRHSQGMKTDQGMITYYPGIIMYLFVYFLVILMEIYVKFHDYPVITGDKRNEVMAVACYYKCPKLRLQRDSNKTVVEIMVVVMNLILPLLNAQRTTKCEI